MIFFVTLTFLLVHICQGLDYNSEMEIYDLYEEVNGTFYEMLGVSNDATVAEVRRAYRKRSKELHPDKNKAENAELMFRQLVGAYEVLKDTEKREMYENVLKYGLPDWRQPSYYYRKYRKMGSLELSIIAALIATIGHYIAWWAAFLEKYHEMEEKLAPERKKWDKKKNKNQDQDVPDELQISFRLERDLGFRKPGRWDFLPFVLFRVTKRFITNIPERIRAAKERKREEEARKKIEEEEAKEAAERAAIPKPKRVPKPKKVLRDASEFDNEASWEIPGLQQETDEDGNEIKKSLKVKKNEWTEDDYAALAKAMAKFPGGTPGRWQRIAHELGRSSSDITKKVKEMKENLTSNQQNANPGSDMLITKKLDINISDTLVTKAIGNELDKTSMFTETGFYQSQDDIPDDLDEGTSYQEPEEDLYIPKKKTKVKTRPVEEKPKQEEEKEEENEEKTTESDKCNDEEVKTENNTEATNNTVVVDGVWTQIQQKCLESAIQQFPKSTTDRWTCISRAVPGKTKEQCVARFKLIVEQILLKKAKQGKGS